MLKRLLSTLALALLLGTPALSLADVTPAEPTIHQIYEAANAGKLADAEAMIDKVLKAHPASAKAHYVHAELLAREGKTAAARSELAKAKELAPGLPFADAAAVGQLTRALEPATTSTPSPARASPAVPAPASAQGSSIPWVPVGLVALVVVGYLAFRRRAGPPAGAAPAWQAPAPGPHYAPPAPYGGGGYGGGYGPGGVAQPPVGQQPGVGRGLGSALATGAAVGLGAVVAEQAFRHFTQDRGDSADRSPSPSSAIDDGNARMGRSLGPGADPVPNADLGGNDFGIQDTGSWDSGSGDGGGGSDDW